jgi:SulP family sulfate permease
MSGVFRWEVVAVGVLVLAPSARFIPKAALAGLLMLTAARLVDWKRVRHAFRASRYDAGLLLITCFSSIFISVEFRFSSAWRFPSCCLFPAQLACGAANWW